MPLTPFDSMRARHHLSWSILRMGKAAAQRRRQPPRRRPLPG